MLWHFTNRLLKYICMIIWHLTNKHIYLHHEKALYQKTLFTTIIWHLTNKFFKKYICIMLWHLTNLKIYLHDDLALNQQTVIYLHQNKALYHKKYISIMICYVIKRHFEYICITIIWHLINQSFNKKYLHHVITHYQRLLKGGLHQKNNNFFFCFKWYHERSWIQEKTFKTYENLCHCENIPFMHIRIREMGQVGRGLLDVTRRQYIKYSTGKLLFLPSGLTIKKTRRMASAKCSRATTGFSTSYGRGKYWLIYQKPGGQEKDRPFTTVVSRAPDSFGKESGAYPCARVGQNHMHTIKTNFPSFCHSIYVSCIFWVWRTPFCARFIQPK